MECPGFEQLIDYCDGRLAGRDAQLVAEHLAAGCRRCGDDCHWYERARAIAAGDHLIEPPPWVLKRAIKLFDGRPARPGAVDHLGRLIASLAFDSLSRSALPGVRLAAAADRHLLYHAGPYSIDLQIAPSGESAVTLTGQVLRADEPRFESVAGLSLELSRAGEAARSTVTNEVGEFTINAVGRGEYDLTIETREGTITLPRMPVTTP